MFKLVISLFILTCFVTQTVGPPSELNRLALPDVFGFVAIVFFLFNGKKIVLGDLHKALIFLLLTYMLGILVTMNMGSTIMELLVFLFLLLIFTIITTVFKKSTDFLKLFKIVIYLTIISSCIGLYDMSTSITNLPRIFPIHESYGVVLTSGFRNGGQAGAFYMVILALLFPLRFSSLYYHFDNKDQKLISIATVLGFLSLLLTVKIISYIGIFLGFHFFLMRRLKKKLMRWYFLLIAGIIAFIPLAKSILPDFYDRLQFKISSRIFEMIDALFYGGQQHAASNFINSNYGKAIEVFLESPLLGSGIGGFYNVHAGYEVHSTYFKLLGEAGIIGILGFLTFLFYLIRLFRTKRYHLDNPYGDFLKNVFPFVLAFLIIWIYNYPIRKREFWIFMALIYLAKQEAVKFELNRFQLYCAQNSS